MRYFQNEKVLLKNLAFTTKNDQKKKIIKYFGYQRSTKTVKDRLLRKIKKLIIIDTNPVYIFRELMNYLDQNKIISPGYTYLQETIGATIKEEKNRLILAVKKHINIKSKTSFMIYYLLKKNYMKLRM